MKTAEQRGMEMMNSPMASLPPLAVEFCNHLASDVGMCMEVMLTAWTVYAQLAEGLICSDDLYRARKKDIDWFFARLPKETQGSISKWAEETFGPSGTNARVAARANEEMSELLRVLTSDDNDPKAAEEAADVVIVLYRLANRMGVNLNVEIDKKMAVNRARKWNRDNTGHGYHVKDTQ